MLANRIASRRKRGFYIIGILIVLAIIAILFGKQLLPDRSGAPSMAQTSIQRSENAACEANRVTIRTNVSSWQIAHMGKAPTIQKLRESGMGIPSCPEGGKYSIGRDGEVYCSVHNPPPGQEPEQPKAPGQAGASNQ